MERLVNPRGGYALIVAMLALVALTLLGVAALSISDIDLTITHNIRRYHQVYNAANAGLDQAKQVTRNIPMNPETIDSLNALAIYGDGMRLIDSSTTPASTALETSGYSVGQYTVDLYYGECGGAPRGFEMAEGINHGGGGMEQKDVFLDVQSTATDVVGSRTRSAASATTGGFLRLLGYCQ